MHRMTQYGIEGAYMKTVKEIIEKYLKDRLEYDKAMNKTVKEIVEQYMQDRKEFEEIRERQRISFL